MPFSDDFMQKVMPAINAPPTQPGLVPGYPNVGYNPNAITPINMPAGPPLPPMPSGPDKLAGGQSVQPPPASVPEPMSYVPAPPPAAPAPPPPPQFGITGGAPAHESLQAGPTQIGLLNRATEGRVGGVEEATRLQQEAVLRQAMQASVAREDAEARAQGAAQAMAAHQKRLDDANDRIGQANQRLQQQVPITDYWSDRGIGKQIVAGLSIALSEFGKALSGAGGPNPALQMIQQDMDRDLKTKELRAQQQERGAMLARDVGQQHFDNLVREFGLDPAKDIYAGAMRDKLAAEAEMRAAATKLPEIQAQAATVAANLRAEADDYKAKALLKYVGAGGRMVFDPQIGYPVPETEYRKFKVDMAKEGVQQQGRETLASMKGEGGEHADINRRFIADKMQTAQIPGTIAALDQAAKGLQGNDSGMSIPARQIYGHGEYGRALYGKLFGEAAAQREQAWGNVTSQVIHSLTGAQANAEEIKRYKAMLDGAGTVEARANAIQKARETLLEKQRNILAGAGPRAATEYLQNMQDLTPPPNVNPTTGIAETPIKR